MVVIKDDINFNARLYNIYPLYHQPCCLVGGVYEPSYLLALHVDVIHVSGLLAPSLSNNLFNLFSCVLSGLLCFHCHP